MPKLSWNKFIVQYSYKKIIAFSAPIPANLPKRIRIILDKNGRKVPTPYGMFSEWCSAYLSGDWAILKVPKGFIVCIITQSDEETIRDEFEITGPVKITTVSNNTRRIIYKTPQYAAMAGDLGYVL